MRLKNIEVNNQKFVFHGESLNIFPVENFGEINEEQLKDFLPEDFNTGNDYIRSVCLVLNNSCNLTCSYCYANKGNYDKPHINMSFADACKTVDAIADNVRAKNGKEFCVAFFGGEPLISYKLIRDVVAYIEARHDDLYCKYKITTNGTLLTKEIVSFMEEKNFSIMISLDGDKSKQDIHRKYENGRGSYDIIAANLNYFTNPFIINARITITDTNADINSYYRSILNSGFQRITYALDGNIDPQNFETFSKSLRLMLDTYIEDIKNGNYYEFTNVSLAIIALLNKRGYKSHCNAGISYITQSADGKLYRCPRFIGNSAHAFEFDSKNILTDASKNAVTEDNAHNKGLLACHTCEYERMCGGVCSFHANKIRSGKVNELFECAHRKIVFEKTLDLMCSLGEQESRSYLFYLEKIWNSNK